jgi:DNA-binding response OmpR family regulator
VRVAIDRKGVAIFGEIAIDFDRMEIRRAGRIVPATALAFRILKFFVDNPHCVFSRGKLLEAIWPHRERVRVELLTTSSGSYGENLRKILLIPRICKRYMARDIDSCHSLAKANR